MTKTANEDHLHVAAAAAPADGPDTTVGAAPVTPGKLSKTAVDATAKSYWESYFGSYGADWVRKIPRKIAAALAAKSLVAQADKAELRPVALVRDAKRGGFVLEAAVRGADGERLMINAQISSTGDVGTVRGLGADGKRFEV